MEVGYFSFIFLGIGDLHILLWVKVLCIDWVLSWGKFCQSKREEEENDLFWVSGSNMCTVSISFSALKEILFDHLLSKLVFGSLGCV